LADYEGGIAFDGISLRDIHQKSLRATVSSYLFDDAIFEGSLLDNIAMNRSSVSYEDVRWALEKAGLTTYVNKLAEGVHTHIGAEGKKMSDSVSQKVLFARAIVSRPKLLIVKDTLPDMCRTDRTKLIEFMTAADAPWTLIAVSNDPTLLSRCNRVLLFDNGKLAAQGTFAELETNPVLKDAIFQD
jgi:ABC-type multidrug transport system fused ATPase/permease subunit